MWKLKSYLYYLNFWGNNTLSKNESITPNTPPNTPSTISTLSTQQVITRDVAIQVPSPKQMIKVNIINNDAKTPANGNINWADYLNNLSEVERKRTIYKSKKQLSDNFDINTIIEE